MSVCDFSLALMDLTPYEEPLQYYVVGTARAFCQRAEGETTISRIFG